VYLHLTIRSVAPGSNFGAAIEHETPFVVSIGRGTMVSDGASLVSAEYSNTSFRVTPVSVEARSFLGNAIVYPCGGRIGDNCPRSRTWSGAWSEFGWAGGSSTTAAPYPSGRWWPSATTARSTPGP
jgi:hypothetical protein